MKTFLTIAFALLVIGAKAQQGQLGSIVQCRPMATKLPELGEQNLLFCEANVQGTLTLLLLPADSQAKAGQVFVIYEAHDVPRYIVLNGKKYYCYLSKYLQKVKA